MFTRLKRQKVKKHYLDTNQSEQSLESKPLPVRNNKYYDTFAFRDRMTNNQFKYRQARQNDEPRLLFNDWTAKQFNNPHKDIRNAMDVYKFTKKFELNCLRSKYFKSTRGDSADETSQQPRSRRKNKQFSIDKDTLFEINKQELRRILDNNEQVDRQILKINKSSIIYNHLHHLKHNPHLKKWTKIENNNTCDKENMTAQQKEIEERVNEKIINHMKCELKVNGEYLLNLPIDKKRKQLIKNQFRKQRSYKVFEYPKYSHTDLSSYTFSTFKSEDYTHLLNETVQKSMESSMESHIIELVKEGYINQVFMELSNRPELFQIRDQYRNNLFHLAAKEGNKSMITMLLKIMPARSSYNLLTSKNHLNRTPRQKASTLCYHQLCEIIDDFIDKFESYLK